MEKDQPQDNVEKQKSNKNNNHNLDIFRSQVVPTMLKDSYNNHAEEFSDFFQSPNQISVQQQNINAAIKQAFRISDLYWERQCLQKVNQNAQQYELRGQILNMQHKMSKKHNFGQIIIKKTEDVIDLQAVLQKGQTNFITTIWNPRYCILNLDKFIYRSSKQKNSEIAGILNFSLVAVQIIPNIKNKNYESFKIRIIGSSKQFLFRGLKSDQTKIWANKLEKISKQSLGYRLKLTYLSNYHRFWRKDCLAERDFRKKAQTCDIILFQGKESSSVLQRAFTREQYDHIAIVLLNFKGDILLFEANGGVGVGLCPWKKFINHKRYSNQEIVVYRQLKLNRTPELLNKVENFVEKNIGKIYKFSLKNLVSSRCSQALSEKKSFFCSSLVAKLYKLLGLIDPHKSSSEYMPYSFSEKQNIPFLSLNNEHVELMPEKIIVFDQKVIDQF